MRPVSFVALLRVLQVVAQYPSGLKASELNAHIRTQSLYVTRRGPASQTTLYHCRNTLLRLGALDRVDSRFLVKEDTPEVAVLLKDEQTDILSAAARDAFSSLVLRNPECKAAFFDLFMQPHTDYDVAQFRQHGLSVVWRRPRDANPKRAVLFEGCNGARVTLQSASAVKSILYGVRYWALRELQLVDEFFREDRGSIIFPVLVPQTHDVHDVVREILKLVSPREDWTILAFSELAVAFGERAHRPLEVLRLAVTKIASSFPRAVMMVPTSSAFATITALSRSREEHELKAYYRDPQGRYISHIKLHKSILDRQLCQAI
jgi:hypothetical protein